MRQYGEHAETESISSVGKFHVSQKTLMPEMSIQGQEANWASDYLDQFDQKSNSAKKLLGMEF